MGRRHYRLEEIVAKPRQLDGLRSKEVRDTKDLGRQAVQTSHSPGARKILLQEDNGQLDLNRIYRDAEESL